MEEASKARRMALGKGEPLPLRCFCFKDYLSTRKLRYPLKNDAWKRYINIFFLELAPFQGTCYIFIFREACFV